MRLKTVREDLAYFTLATGERTRNLAYAGIGAAWIINSTQVNLAPLLLYSILTFSAYFMLDVWGAIYCAKKAREIILHHEEIVFNDTGKLPDDNYEFEYDPKLNGFSEQVVTIRPWLAALGYAPIALHLILNAACRGTQS